MAVNYEIYLNDSNLDYDQAEQHFADADRWAKDQCASYLGFDVQDVSDVSYVYDQVAVYVFGAQEDLFMFKLKYGGST